MLRLETKHCTSTPKRVFCAAVLLFSKSNKIIFGYFDPEKILKINNFRCDLTDVLAKKKHCCAGH